MRIVQSPEAVFVPACKEGGSRRQQVYCGRSLPSSGRVGKGL
ncbi:hypothetical protein [Nostoc sp. FACHB-888]|nr:hypothetical protein [Nostoc sp. FACHB-888]